MDGLSRDKFYKLVCEDYSINVHHHVWTKKALLNFFKYFGFKILLAKIRGNTIHVILRKVE